MQKDHVRWYSHRLGRDMGVAVYGHYGLPVLAFPTSGGEEWELEQMGLIPALAPYIDAGRVKFFAVGSNLNQPIFPDIYKSYWVLFVEDLYVNLFWEAGRAWNGKLWDAGLFEIFVKRKIDRLKERIEQPAIVW